jgi:aryl-alcohol dehydrogenase-like predicted oxidoreductase
VIGPTPRRRSADHARSRATAERAAASSADNRGDIARSLTRGQRAAIALLLVEPLAQILNRSIEQEVLPICQRFGMGTLVWSPLGQGMLTGRHRKAQGTATQRSSLQPHHFGDERTLDGVEQLVPLAEEAGLPITHLALAFAIAHPAVTSAILGPRTMEQLDDLLAGADVTLNDDDLLDRIDEIAPPGPTPDPTRWPGRHRPSRTSACADRRSSAPPPETSRQER